MNSGKEQGVRFPSEGKAQHHHGLRQAPSCDIEDV